MERLDPHCDELFNDDKKDDVNLDFDKEDEEMLATSEHLKHDFEDPLAAGIFELDRHELFHSKSQRHAEEVEEVLTKCINKNLSGPTKDMHHVEQHPMFRRDDGTSVWPSWCVDTL